VSADRGSVIGGNPSVLSGGENLKELGLPSTEKAKEDGRGETA